MKFKITIKSKNFNQCAMNSFLYFLAIRVDYNPGQNILEHDRNLQILQFQPPSPQSQCWNWANFEKKVFQNQHWVQGEGGGSVGGEIYEISVFVPFILSEIVWRFGSVDSVDFWCFDYAFYV